MRLDDLHLWYLGDPAVPRYLGGLKLVVTSNLHFTQAGVSARDIETLAEYIDGETLLAQREGFDPARFQSAPARKPRTNPFRRR